MTEDRPAVRRIILSLFEGDPLSRLRRDPKKSTNRYSRALQYRGIPLLDVSQFKPKRILILNASLAAGGAERQIVNTMIGLKERGFDDMLLLCDRLSSDGNFNFYQSKLKSEGIASRERANYSQRRTANNHETLITALEGVLRNCPGFLKEEIKSYATEILEIRPWVVHAWQDATSVKAGLAAALVGVPRIILSGRSMAPYHFNYYLPYFKPIYEALAMRQNVQLLNNSNAGARDYQGWLGHTENPIGVVFNGIAQATPARSAQREMTKNEGFSERSETDLVVGTIMRFHEEKDPILWVRVAAAVSEAVPEARFLMVGEGPLRDRTLGLSRDLGLGGRISIREPTDKPEKAFAEMNVFLLSSRLEGTSNVCIEAQLLGVPVVAPDVGGIEDTILSGKTGWIVEQRTVAALAERVIASLRDAGWRRNAAVEAPNFVRSRFGLQRMISETIQYYALD